MKDEYEFIMTTDDDIDGEEIPPLSDAEALRMLRAFIDASGGVFRPRNGVVPFDTLRPFLAFIDCNPRLS